jgi:hypothetical protein
MAVISLIGQQLIYYLLLLLFLYNRL